MPYHKVKQGECISSICHDTGRPIETVWNHPNNKELREKRRNPDILFPGDELFIPETSAHYFHGKSGQQHILQLKNGSTALRIKLANDDGTPRSNVAYILEVGEEKINGNTSEKGEIVQLIPANLSEAKLIVEDEQYILKCGHLDPIDEICGMQGRLFNLGFYRGEITGNMNEETEEAILAFQQFYGIEETGEGDNATLALLERVYGS